VVALTIRFESGGVRRDDGGLNGAIAVNVGLEGATGYVIKWFT